MENITLANLATYVVMAIPIATFGALFVAVILFTKNKGTMDALKEAVNTYKTLAESKDAEVKQLEKKINDLEKKIEELSKAVESQKGAVTLAVDELLSGFVRHGVCTRATSCKDFMADD